MLGYDFTQDQLLGEVLGPDYYAGALGTAG
jgi:hypothetical protein